MVEAEYGKIYHEMVKDADASKVIENTSVIGRAFLL